MDMVSVGGWKLYNRVPRESLRIHLFSHFWCTLYNTMYRLATIFRSQMDRQREGQTDDSITPITDHKKVSIR